MFQKGFDIQGRCRALGYELFERAHANEPHVWNRAWWDRKMLEYFSEHPQLQTQLFRFIEALPYMRDDADIADHFKQYLQQGDMDLPLPFQMAIAFRRPDSAWGRVLGANIRKGSFMMARGFMTGTNTTEAIAYAQALRRRGMTFTLDVLGEATIGEQQADAAANTYMELIEALGRASQEWQRIPLLDATSTGPMPRANISVKLTALDPVFDPVDPERAYDVIRRRLSPLLLRARELDVFVNVDMEAFRYRDMTLWIFKKLLTEPEFRDWPDAGIVVQAYLRDARDDLLGLLDWVEQRGTGIGIRLVKGAYWDTETTQAIRNHASIPVWIQKWQSDACYEELTAIMLQHADLIRPAFASHNVRSLAHVMAVAESLDLSPRDYELQMLAGMGEPLKAAIQEMGRCLRVYCPYGELIKGMAYLIRRLLENTSNDSFLKNRFGDRSAYDALLSLPESAALEDDEPTDETLPSRHYEDPFEDCSMIASSVGLDFKNTTAIGFSNSENRERIGTLIGALRSKSGKDRLLKIGGEEIRSEAWLTSHDPANPDQVVARVATAELAHADQVVAAASKALPSWRSQPFDVRADILRRVAKSLEERRFEFIAQLVREIGKNPIQADGEVVEAIDYFNYHAALLERLGQRPRRRDVPGEENVLVYEPCGVCLLIGPWDFPLAMLSAMVSASVAMGNASIVKPSSKAPIVAAMLMELLADARLPDGVVNYVPAAGSSVGQALVEHPDVHLVAFCGSSPNAVKVAEAAARVRPRQGHFKRTIIDAGGQNAIIVDHDVDVDEAVMGVLESAFAFGGQKCTACSRVIVLADVYDEFCRKLAGAAEQLEVGDPADVGHSIGPVIDGQTQERLRELIVRQKESYPVLFETDASRVPVSGFYVAPVIFKDVDPESELAQDEVFGPVLAIMKADDFEHAIELANGSPYALTGGIYSRSPAHIAEARERFRVGNLYINRKITGSQVDVQPYGGRQLSGDGARLGSLDYLLQYCRPRTISENTLRQGLTKSRESAE